MEKSEILVIGKNEGIVNVISRLINNNDRWQAAVAYDLTQAKARVSTRPFQLVLVGGGLTEAEEQEITALVKDIYPSLPIVKHYGGGSGLLYAEIYQALKEEL